MSNESPKQTLLNDFSHRLKMEGEEQLCDCVNELKLGLSSNNKYDLFKNKKPHCGNAKYQKVQRWQ